MDQLEKLRREETRRLLEWISSNQEQWFGITLALTEENMLIGKELKEVIRDLKNNGFYQLLVLLAYSKNNIIRNSIEKSMLDIICETWTKNSFEKAIDLLIDNIN